MLFRHPSGDIEAVGYGSLVFMGKDGARNVNLVIVSIQTF